MFCSRNVSYNLFHYFIYYIDMGIKKTIVQKVYFLLWMQTFFHNVTVGLFVAENSVCDLLLIFMAIFTLFIFFIETCQK